MIFATHLSGASTKRAPTDEPTTTWAMATSSMGGAEAVRPVMCTAALATIGPTSR